MKFMKMTIKEFFRDGFFDETLNSRLKHFLTILFLVASVICYGLGYTKSFYGFLGVVFLCGISIMANTTEHVRLVDTLVMMGNTIIVTGIFLHGREFAPMSFFFVIVMAIACLLILGTHIGSLFSVYYFFIAWLACWTPFLPRTRALYNITYLRRFPLLLLGFIGIAYIICYEIQKYDWNHKRYKSQLEMRIAYEQEKLGDMSLRLVTTMFQAESAKAPEVTEHSEKVAKLSRNIAKEMGLSEEMQSKLYYAGLLHDVGKMEIRDVKLDLDEQEKQDMQEEKSRIRSKEADGTYQFHAEQGSIFLKHLQLPIEITDAAMYHHENYDGTGFPSGLKGEDIPLSARIVAVANAIIYEQDQGAAVRKVVSLLQDKELVYYDPKVTEAAIEVLGKG